MRILLDTHILLWWLADDRRLPDADAGCRCRWQQRGVRVRHFGGRDRDQGFTRKAESPGGLAAVIATSGLSHLPFTAEHADHLSALPWHHRDPFDRMLIAQAVVESMTFASVDPGCRSYDVRLFG